MIYIRYILYLKYRLSAIWHFDMDNILSLYDTTQFSHQNDFDKMHLKQMMNLKACDLKTIVLNCSIFKNENRKLDNFVIQSN